MQTDSLTTKIKQLEKQSEYKIPFNEFAIVRIDGHKFSKFTKKFKKPFDFLLSTAMENTTKDLIERFGVSLGYTQSDEISLIFPPSFTEKDGDITNNQIFGGRTQKMASLIASYTSIRFNYWLKKGYVEYKSEKTDTQYIKMIKDKIGTAWFDARVFGVPTKEDAFLVIMWRYQDCIKNSKSMFAQAYCPHKSLLNKTGNQQISYCLNETGNDWYRVEDRFRFGIFSKKEQYLKPVDNPIMSKEVSNSYCIRTRVCSLSLNSFICNEENIDFVVNKFI